MSDWDAERYHRVSNPQLEWGRRVLRRLGPEPGERILDIGCGTGRLTSELFAAMGEGLVVAIDRSEAMLREAASRHLWHRGPHPVATRQAADAPACRPRRRRGAAVRRHLRRGAEHGDVSLDPRPRPALRQHLPRAGAGRPARRAVRRRRQPRPPAGSGPAALMTEPPLSRPFRRLARSLGVCRRADHDRAAGPGRASRRSTCRSSRAPTIRRSRELSRVSSRCVCLRDHLAAAAGGAERPAIPDTLADEAAADSPPFTLDYWRLNIAGPQARGHRAGGVTAAPVPYARTPARHAAVREKEAQLSKRISRLRLTTFLLGAGILVWSAVARRDAVAAGRRALLFVAFGSLVVWHARVDERVAWHDALRLVNLRALARGARDWSRCRSRAAGRLEPSPITRTRSTSICSAAPRSFSGSGPRRPPWGAGRSRVAAEPASRARRSASGSRPSGVSPRRTTGADIRGARRAGRRAPGSRRSTLPRLGRR